ncbi:MAG: hypothetical protein FH748_12915 [Balneolaceae bacterium]|nr:hypothetical protein [Balneolaceae bacterium]
MSKALILTKDAQQDLEDASVNISLILYTARIFSIFSGAVTEKYMSGKSLTSCEATALKSALDGLRTL